MRIHIEECAALVIDIQSRLFPHISDFNKLEDRLLKLIQGLKVLQVPIIVTEQYSKGLGSTIERVQEALLDEYQPIEKMHFSCCDDEHFINALKTLGKRKIIMCGIESHVCVLQTTVDLISMGYEPVVVEDCIASRSPVDKFVSVERMRTEGAILTTYESILFELCRESGTETFKAISYLVK